MGLVEQLATGTEEAAEALRELYGMITKLNGDFENTCGEINTASEAWTTFATGISEILEQIAAKLTEGSTNIGSMGTAIAAALAGMEDGLSTFENEMDSLDSELEDLEFESVDSGLEEFRSAGQQVVESCQELGALLDSDGQELRTKMEELLDLGSETNMFVTNSSETASTVQGVLETEMGEAGSAIGQELKEQGLASLNDFETHLGSELQETFTNGMTELQDKMQTAYTDFDEAVGQFTGDLQDKLEEAASQLATAFTDEAREQIETFLKDAIEDAVEEFAKAAAEDVAMMGIGVQVTGALSPILPELKVAERVLPVFNAALAAMKIF